MPKQEHHADPESLLGQLQRGRGEGYRRILSIPRGEAWNGLVDCICNDPRLDSQVEDRAAYYASMASETRKRFQHLASDPLRGRGCPGRGATTDRRLSICRSGGLIPGSGKAFAVYDDTMDDSRTPMIAATLRWQLAEGWTFLIGSVLLSVNQSPPEVVSPGNRGARSGLTARPNRRESTRGHCAQTCFGGRMRGATRPPGGRRHGLPARANARG